jgi:diaminopimelate epimerase
MSVEKPISFIKMHGLGNDFVVVDAIRQQVDWTPDVIAALARRDTGIGFDQCLMVERSSTPGIDFFYRIYNADGQSVGQCGNGARCLARFIRHVGLSTKTDFIVATETTQMRLQCHSDETVSVDFSEPLFNPEDIPLLLENVIQYPKDYAIAFTDGTLIRFSVVNVGNPHAVILVPDIQKVPVAAVGAFLSTHPAFPEHINVGFMEIVSSSDIKLRVYERGCGETKACGSGAVAAAVIGRQYHGLDHDVTVSLPGGCLSVHAPLSLRGPAVFVYSGIV